MMQLQPEITLATIVHTFNHMTTAEDDAKLQLIDDGEYLLIIQNTTASDITELDFTDVDISESSRNATNKDNTD